MLHAWQVPPMLLDTSVLVSMIVKAVFSSSVTSHIHGRSLSCFLRVVDVIPNLVNRFAPIQRANAVTKAHFLRRKVY